MFRDAGKMFEKQNQEESVNWQIKSPTKIRQQYYPGNELSFNANKYHISILQS